jgi:hypothetical protein
LVAPAAALHDSDALLYEALTLLSTGAGGIPFATIEFDCPEVFAPNEFDAVTVNV